MAAKREAEKMKITDEGPKNETVLGLTWNSYINYSLEIITCGTDRENTIMQRLQSKSARLTLGWK